MIEEEVKNKTVVTIDHKGVMNQCTIMGSRQVDANRELEVLVKVCNSRKREKNAKPEDEKKKTSMFGRMFS